MVTADASQRRPTSQSICISSPLRSNHTNLQGNHMRALHRRAVLGRDCNVAIVDHDVLTCIRPIVGDRPHRGSSGIALSLRAADIASGTASVSRRRSPASSWRTRTPSKAPRAGFIPYPQGSLLHAQCEVNAQASKRYIRTRHGSRSPALLVHRLDLSRSASRGSSSQISSTLPNATGALLVSFTKPMLPLRPLDRPTESWDNAEFCRLPGLIIGTRS
jgi:hypothetical protein